jgi:hypothetical protein
MSHIETAESLLRPSDASETIARTRREEMPMDPGKPPDETFNPWSIVNLVFHHLADEGLHPILGSAGDPGAPAAELLRSLGITPAPEGNRQVSQKVRQELADIRAAMFDES